MFVVRALLLGAFAAALSSTAANMQSYDCKMRQVGLDYAQSLQPFRSMVRGRPIEFEFLLFLR